MGSLAEAIRAAMLGDPTLAALLTGGVWNQPLARSTAYGDDAYPVEGATPGAFEPTPPFRLRPSCVVLDRGEKPAAGGPAEGIAIYPRLHFYAADDRPGRTALRSALHRARAVLDGSRLTCDEAIAPVLVRPLRDRLGERPSPEFDDAVMDVDRYQAIGLWRTIS